MLIGRNVRACAADSGGRHPVCTATVDRILLETGLADLPSLEH